MRRYISFIPENAIEITMLEGWIVSVQTFVEKPRYVIDKEKFSEPVNASNVQYI